MIRPADGDRTNRGSRTVSVLLKIADICLDLEYPADLELENREAFYRSFLYSARDCDSLPVRIRRVSSLSTGPDSTPLFDSAQSWLLYRTGPEYAVVVTPTDLRADPLCIARFRTTVEGIQIEFRDSPAASQGQPPFVASNPFSSYPLDRILMTYILAVRQGVQIHAAGARIGDSGFLFAGLSGAGKTTLARQLRSSRGALVLTDERVIVRKIGDGVHVFGTPWKGEAGIAVNESAPLKGIFFIVQSSNNRIVELGRQDALRRLLALATVPWYDPDIMTPVLGLCEEVLGCVPSFELQFTPGPGVVRVVEEFVARAG